jgi:hypothetical protein
MLVLHCAAFYWLVGGAAGRAVDVARGMDGGLGGGECLHQPDRVPSSCCYAPAKPDDLLRPRRGNEFDIDDHYGPILGLTGVIAATVMSYLVFICVPILLDAERLLSRLRGQAEAKRSVA